MSYKFDMQGERLWKYRAALDGPVARCTPNTGSRHARQAKYNGLASLKTVYEIAFAETLAKRRMIQARQLQRRAEYTK